MTAIALLRRIRHSAVAWGMGIALLRMGGALIVLPCTVRKIASPVLGVWYGFLAIQNFINLVDLGFGDATTRAAGYLWGGARELKAIGIDRTAAGEPEARTGPNLPLLSGLVATMRWYYRALSLIVGCLTLLVGGWWVWRATADLPNAGEIRLAYQVFILGAVLQTLGTLWPSLLTGINGVRKAQELAFYSVLASYVITLVGLQLNLGLWALVAAYIGSTLFLRLAGRSAFLRIAGDALDRGARWRPDLLKTLWPTAWRTAVVGLGTFMILSANTLICGIYLDLKTTASFGLTLQCIGFVIFAGNSLVYIKLPEINQLRVAGRMDGVVSLWIARTRLGIATYAAGGVGLVTVGPWLLTLTHSKTPLLPTGPLIAWIAIIGLEVHHAYYSALVLSENRNPFMLPTLLSGFCVVALSLLLTPQLGVWGMILAQGVVQAAFNNWWTVLQGIKGLEMKPSDYWRLYFRLPVGLSL